MNLLSDERNSKSIKGVSTVVKNVNKENVLFTRLYIVSVIKIVLILAGYTEQDFGLLVFYV